MDKGTLLVYCCPSIFSLTYTCTGTYSRSSQILGKKYIYECLILDVGGEEAVASVEIVAVAEVAGHGLHHVRHRGKGRLPHVQRQTSTGQCVISSVAAPNKYFLKI
jgi:hypothetical protein